MVAHHTHARTTHTYTHTHALTCTHTHTHTIPLPYLLTQLLKDKFKYYDDNVAYIIGQDLHLCRFIYQEALDGPKILIGYSGISWLVMLLLDYNGYIAAVELQHLL